MESTEFASEVFEIDPILMASTEVPTSTPTSTPVIAPVDINVGDEDKNDRRFGTRKTTNADGSVSYGLKADGTPRKRPGRKPKSSS